MTGMCNFFRHSTGRNSISGVSALLISVVGLASCGSDLPDFSEFHSIPQSSVWAPGADVLFEPFPADSIKAHLLLYDVTLCLRHSLPAPTEVRIVVEQEDLHSPTVADTLTFRLLTPDGRPIGQGNYGVYAIETTIAKARRISEGYSVAVHPADSVSAVTEVGVILTPSI